MCGCLFCRLVLIRRKWVTNTWTNCLKTDHWIKWLTLKKPGPFEALCLVWLCVFVSRYRSACFRNEWIVILDCGKMCFKMNMYVSMYVCMYICMYVHATLGLDFPLSFFCWIFFLGKLRALFWWALRVSIVWIMFLLVAPPVFGNLSLHAVRVPCRFVTSHP